MFWNRKRVETLGKRVALLESVEVAAFENIIKTINKILQECKGENKLNIPRINKLLEDLTISAIYEAAKEDMQTKEEEKPLPTLKPDDEKTSAKEFKDFVDEYLDGPKLLGAVEALTHATLSIYTYLHVRCSHALHTDSCTKNDVKRALGIPRDGDVGYTLLRKVQHYYSCVNAPLVLEMEKLVLVSPPWRLNCGSKKFGGLGSQSGLYLMLKGWITNLPILPEHYKRWLTSLGYTSPFM